MDLFDQIEGYREAVDKEGGIWDAAFLGMSEYVCGVEVKAFTPRHFLILGWNGLRSPLICGNFPNSDVDLAVAVGQFFWIVSPSFNPIECRIVQRIKQSFYLRKVGKLEFKQSLEGLAGYIAEAFQDSPPAVKDSIGESYYSWFAGYCDVFASEYGWPVSQVIDMPMKQLFQLGKLIKKRHNPKCHLFKPSDRIASDWLDTQQPKQN